ncbi:MAG: class I SAM-dependent methyltransferase [Bifidobacteriaceae bacterium]|nr:class I SAM-dependent methyltransferase [Bifidobacteriaceae bacterium]
MTSPQDNRAQKGVNPRYSTGAPHGNANTTPTTQQQYFSASPASADTRHTTMLTLRGHKVPVQLSNGVFSAKGLDKGTTVLLKLAPTPPAEGHFLDLGCGWGPIALSLALESPKAHITALDVNERALDLTRVNAKALGLPGITPATAEDIPEDARFDLIWSNPPIRVGKKILHELLLTYLPRLTQGGAAYLVVQKHLGADSLIPWLSQSLGRDFEVSRYDSSKGFRIIEVLHTPQNDSDRAASHKDNNVHISDTVAEIDTPSQS